MVSDERGETRNASLGCCTASLGVGEGTMGKDDLVIGTHRSTSEALVIN